MMHFVSIFLIMRAQGVRVIAIEEVQNYEKNCIHQKHFQKWLVENAYLSSYPLDPPRAISHKNHQKSLAYFSHLAPLVLFLFTKRRSEKRGATAQWPPP